MEVEGVVTDTPGDGTFFCSLSSLICLAFNTQIHDVVATDGTVVNDNVPSPKSDSIPLLHLELLLVVTRAVGRSRFGDRFDGGLAIVPSGRRVRHLNIRHICGRCGRCARRESKFWSGGERFAARELDGAAGGATQIQTVGLYQESKTNAR